MSALAAWGEKTPEQQQAEWEARNPPLPEHIEHILREVGAQDYPTIWVDFEERQPLEKLATGILHLLVEVYEHALSEDTRDTLKSLLDGRAQEGARR